MATNLELKVRCGREDLTAIRSRAEGMGAGRFEELRQTDTYFRARTGRLKLREIESATGSSCELIGYHRPDDEGARWSSYIRADIAVSTAADLKTALDSTLGVWQVVEKWRTVGIWKRTRIHLDWVEGLGAFVELETVTASDDDQTAESELRDVVEYLGLNAFDVVAGSYSDLIASRGER
ncbi:MAG: class IV adenylate cyclase [Thermomicrobiales bacterium]|nr:class IV adenylate cyclase [Thermomicrobiales bacterium]